MKIINSKYLIIIIIVWYSSIFSSSCTTNPSIIAAKGNLLPKLNYTKDFIITSYVRPKTSLQPNKPLFIYIEGDGKAWMTRTRLSNNPTPNNPVALKLAALDPNPNVIYIARPCQYTPLNLDLNCHCKYWSKSRYSKIVIAAVNQVIDNFKLTISKISGSLKNNKNYALMPKIHLIGYSGGATIAQLLAAIRTDVISIRTIAGNLDHDAVSAFHGTSKLDDSLNPIDFVQNFNEIPQIHYLGVHDQIIPSYVCKNFVALVNKSNKNLNKCANYQLIDNLDHYSGWEAFWQQQMHLIPYCTPKSTN